MLSSPFNIAPLSNMLVRLRTLRDSVDLKLALAAYRIWSPVLNRRHPRSVWIFLLRNMRRRQHGIRRNRQAAPMYGREDRLSSHLPRLQRLSNTIVVGFPWDRPSR